MPWSDDPDCMRVKLDALRLVEEQGGLGIWSRDLDAGEVKWTTSLYRLLGLVPFRQPASVELYLSIMHPDDRPDAADWLRLAGTPEGHRHRVVRADGEIRWLRFCLKTVHSREGVPARQVGVVFDITDFTRGDEAYQREAGLVSAMRSLTDGVVWITAADGSVVDPVGWRAAVGQHSNNHMGWRRLDEVHPEDRDIVRKAWDEALRNRRRYTAEYRARWHGDYAMVSSRGSAIHDPAGGLLAWVGTSQVRPAAPGSPARPVADKGPNAAQIRAARAMLGWTGRQLADKAGLSFSTIRRAEIDGRRTIGTAAVEAISRCFELSGISFTLQADGSFAVTRSKA